MNDIEWCASNSLEDICGLQPSIELLLKYAHMHVAILNT